MGCNNNFRIKKLILLICLVLVSISIYGQELVKVNDAVECFNERKIMIKNILNNYRLYAYSSLDPRGTIRTIATCHKPIGALVRSLNSFEHDGDLSINALTDSVMRKRIIQLLNDEYYEGELDSIANYISKRPDKSKYPSKEFYINSIDDKEKIKEEFSKKNHFVMGSLIEYCGYLQDDEIKELLLKSYLDKRFETKRDDYLIESLARMGEESFLTMYIDKYKFDENDDAEKMLKKLVKLASIPRKETYYELTKYLFTEKKIESYTESDFICDTIEEDGYEELIPIEIIVPEGTSHTLYEFIKVFAFEEIQACIGEERLSKLLKDLPTRPNSWVDIHLIYNEYLTTKRCKKICKWMKKNYTNYLFINRW